MTSSLSHAARAKLANAYRDEQEHRSPDLTPSITFCNASPCRPAYTGNRMGTSREGANQHFQFTGGGYQPQIERATS